MQRGVTLLLAAALWAAPSASRPALAQTEDWSVSRDPFDKRLVARYKALLAKDPDDRHSFGKLVALYRKHRSLDALIAEFEAAHAKSARYATAMLLGHLQRERGDDAAALARYEEAATLSPEEPAAHLARAELLQRSGAADAARDAYDRALAHAPAGDKSLRKQVLRALVDLALGGGDIERARGYFDDYIALEPGNAQLRVELADALAQHKRYKDALDALAAAEKRLGGDPQARVDVIARIGAVREAMGEDDAAIREYQRAIGAMKRDYHLRRELTERMVDIHRRREDLPSLIAQLEKDWPRAQREHLEWDVLARLYEEVGAQEQAIEAFRAAVKKASYELDTQRRLISLLENSGRDDEALAQYEIVIKVAPGEPRFQLELAERYWRRGDQAKALALLDKIEKRFPFDPGVQVALADLYAQWGKEKEALQVYVHLTRIEPDELEHLVNLGDQYFQRGQKDEAVATWKKIAARKTPDGYARLADVFAEHDMLRDAEKMYAKAIAGDAKNPARYRGRAQVYERLKEYQSAVDDWTRALELTPDKPSERPARREARKRIVANLHQLGSNYLASKKREWQAAFAANPPDLEAGYFLVEIYDRRNTAADRKEALTVLRAILDIAPEDRDAMYMLAKLLADENQPLEAIALLERLAAISPGRERELYNEIAELKAALGEDDDAIRYAELALEKSPNDPVAYEQLAKLYERMEKHERARAAYAKVIELNPRNFRVYARLATLLERDGKKVEAAELYRAILRKATDEPTLQKAARKAIDLEEMTGTLGELERVVAPLAFTFSHKPVYRTIVVGLYDRYVPLLVAQSRGSDAEAAAAAAAELERLGQHGLKPLLEALADKENTAQQRIAVAVLGHLGNKGAAMPLVRLASEAQLSRPIGATRATLEFDVRVDALVAAGRLADARVIPALVELMGVHADSLLQAAVTYALGTPGDQAAARPLLAALDSSAVPVATLACFGLANIGDRSHRAAIEGVVADRRAHRHTRAACAFALGYLGDAAAVPTLLATLDDGNELVQRVAAWSLGRIADPRALPALLGAYFEKGEGVRQAIAWAVPRVAAGKPDARPIAALRDYPMQGGRYQEAAAIEAVLGELDAAPMSPALVLGNEASIASGLRDALRATHTNRSLRALSDLSQRDAGASLGALTRGLDAESPDVRTRVEAALAAIAAEVAPELDRLAREHRDPEVRIAALGAIARHGPSGAGDALRAGLADARGSVRIAAMAAAAHHARLRADDRAALAAAIAGRMSAPGWEERKAAAETLAAFGDAAPSDALVAALSDDVGFVRQHAARALGALRRRDAVPALLAATRDEDIAGVRLAAVQSLVAIGDPAARDRLAEIARSDPDDEVRAAAAEAK